MVALVARVAEIFGEFRVTHIILAWIQRYSNIKRNRKSKNMHERESVSKKGRRKITNTICNLN